MLNFAYDFAKITTPANRIAPLNQFLTAGLRDLDMAGRNFLLECPWALTLSTVPWLPYKHSCFRSCLKGLSMVRSLFITSFVARSLQFGLPRPDLAWHEVGHMLTVLVAYKQLSPGDTPSPAVKKLVAILKHHPRYQEDFAGSMPKGLTEDGEARWLLCRASVWPDQLRIDRENAPSYPPQPAKQGSYHRGIWHYIDTPLVIVAAGTSDERSRPWKRRPVRARIYRPIFPATKRKSRTCCRRLASIAGGSSRARPKKRPSPSAGCCTRWATFINRCMRRPPFRSAC